MMGEPIAVGILVGVYWIGCAIAACLFIPLGSRRPRGMKLSHQPQPTGEEPPGSTSAPHPVGTNGDLDGR